MKVIILGASGFIGLPVAQALVRAGHIVYGQTRSAPKSKQLAAEEIIPIIAEETDVESWKSILVTADAVINASGGPDIKTTSAVVLERVSAIAQSLRPPQAPKLAYIYCSGCWVHGDDRVNIVSDTTPCTKPVSLVAWRLEREQDVVTNKVLNGIVVRPSLLYGRSGSLLGSLLKMAYDGQISWFGKPGGRYATIHQDDLADFFLRVVEKSSLVSGKIFDATNNSTESVDDLLDKLCRISGAKGYTYTEPSNAYEEAMQSTTLIRPYLGRALLGWEPRKASYVDGLEIYYASWKASEGLV